MGYNSNCEGMLEISLISYHRVPNCFTEYTQNIHGTDHSVLRRPQPKGQHLTWEGLVIART